MEKSIIGVFDSGIGGYTIAKAIEKELPDSDVIFVNDKAHVPYGTKPMDEVFSYVLPILNSLVNRGCQVIVIACNTVSTNLIDQLREQIPVTIIGMEPMVQMAATQTKSGVVAVCATPATLSSERYSWLKSTYANDVVVLEPDCSNWSTMIENNQINQESIDNQINSVCSLGADIIVLGCTHYHWIEQDIKEATKGRAQVLHPEKLVISQLRRVLLQLQ